MHVQLQFEIERPPNNKHCFRARMMMKTSQLTFECRRLLCLGLVLVALSWSIVSTRCDEEIQPITFFLNKHDEYIVKTQLICRGYPCPNFTVTADVTPYVQERHYNDQEIISSTNYGCDNFTAALLQGYIQLYRYRKGENKDNVQIEMSVPVVVEVTKPLDQECSYRYKVWIYTNVKANNTSNVNPLPHPTDAVSVTIEDLDAKDVYVRTVPGNYSDSDNEVKKLEHDLHEAKLCFNKTRYMIAMYDPPWKKRGRRNEIWLDKESC